MNHLNYLSVLRQFLNVLMFLSDTWQMMLQVFQILLFDMQASIHFLHFGHMFYAPCDTWVHSLLSFSSAHFSYFGLGAIFKNIQFVRVIVKADDFMAFFFLLLAALGFLSVSRDLITYFPEARRDANSNNQVKRWTWYGPGSNFLHDELQV